MRLTTKGRFAVTAMIDLALRSDDGPVTLAGISDRKRPFSLLRLTGVPVGILRRVVALEAALPLVVAAVLVTVVGLLGAELFLRSQLDVSIRWPGLLYWLVVVIGIVVSLGLLVSTFPLIERITGPEAARSE